MAQLTVIPDKTFKEKALPEIDNMIKKSGATRATIIRLALQNWFHYAPTLKTKQWMAGIHHEEEIWERSHDSIQVNIDQQLKDEIRKICKQNQISVNIFVRNIVMKALGV